MVYGETDERNDVQVVGYVTRSELTALQALAKEDQRTVSALVRIAIRQLLDGRQDGR